MKQFLIILSLLLLGSPFCNASANDEIRQSVQAIYQLGDSFERLLKQHSVEDEVKQGLLKIVTQITAGELYARWNDFINQTPISSSFYRKVFESMTPQKRLRLQSVKQSGSKATVTTSLTVSELYAPSIDMISLDELYAKYKISNMTLVEVINMLPMSSLSELVEYRINSERQDTHSLKMINGRWRITKIDQSIVSSTIEVILPKKQKK